MAPVSKAQQKAVAKYMKENYDEFKIRAKKGSKLSIQTIAAQRGESVNGYIKNAVKARYEADTGEEIEL
jgi:predicted HicB family RNase H-like nuclease